MYYPQSGMPINHFNAFLSAAESLQRVIAVRNTNTKSTPWISQGFPPKPMKIKIKTSKTTGFVTCVNSLEVTDARQKGYFVVDADLKARDANGNELIGAPRYPMSVGVVIDPKQKKPLVGDYDLLAVIDPNAKGRNIVLAVVDGVAVEDRISPDVRKVADAVNRKLDQPRVMHGAQDQFDDLPNGDSVAFFPNGLAMLLTNRDATRTFYELLGRQTIKGQYA